MSVNKSKGPIIDPGMCRCCGVMKRCRLINVEYEYLGKKEIYSDLMMDCFGLLLSHLDSKQTERLICATCVSRLREASSFRKQVLRCEEAFLQMKMYYDDNEVSEQKHTDNQKQTVQVEIVKSEPAEKVSDDERSPSPFGDALADDCAVDCDNSMEVLKIEKTPTDKTDSNSDEIPISQISASMKRLRRISNGLPSKKIKTELAAKSGVSCVTSELTQARFRPVTPMKSKPNNLPLARVQQLIREKDPSYVRETNILTIVEYSYAVPFKCRHNHLLCYYCGQNFIDPHLLREHTTTHNPKKFKVAELRKMIKVDLTRIDCRLCPERIESLEQFKVHITIVHNKKYYKALADWILPFKLESNETKCVLCDETFAYFHALNKHMNVHYRNFVCETCGLGFVDHGRFFMHQQRHENGDFPCEICGKVFKAAYNKDLHVDRVHKKKGRVFCPKCDVKLMSYPQKLKHLVEVHGEQPLSFPCTMCDKVYETRRMLTIHIRKEHLKDYRYECQYCGQKFFTRFALNNHMPTHTGERNFKCKVCEKTYPRLKTLKDHMRIHTNDRRYRCHICGQAFIQNCSLKGHMKSQHPEYG